MEPVIRVSNLSKRYHRGGGQNYGTLRESIYSKFRLRGRAGSAGTGGGPDTFLALDDVSFEVAPGEVLGVIGPNGAGKSTALKILSRITRPTSGRVELYGRVRSLLEVGTGFHPELTGRENIFLNGAILGMRRSEIARKFDEIVAFAEVEKFIDMPVKHYSSGMYVRLAFAVAAHLEPEILLVDEVLAVGDSRFYGKSTDKMRQLNAQGMTIILVSHQMWLIQSVCHRGILLRHGKIAAEGPPQSVIEAHRRLVDLPAENGASTRAVSGEAAIEDVELIQIGDWVSGHEATPWAGMKLRCTVRVPGKRRVKFVTRVASADGFTFFNVYSDPVEVPPAKVLTCETTIPQLMLHSGDYFVWTGVCSDRENEEMLAETRLPLAVKESGPLHPQRGIFWNNASWEIR